MHLKAIFLLLFIKQKLIKLKNMLLPKLRQNIFKITIIPYLIFLAFRFFYIIYILFKNDYSSFNIYSLYYQETFNDYIKCKAGFERVKSPFDIIFENATAEFYDKDRSKLICKISLEKGEIKKGEHLIVDKMTKVESVDYELVTEILKYREKHPKLVVVCSSDIWPRFSGIRCKFKRKYEYIHEFKNSKHEHKITLDNFKILDNNNKFVTILLKLNPSEFYLPPFLSADVPKCLVKVKKIENKVEVAEIKIHNGIILDFLEFKITIINNEMGYFTEIMQQYLETKKVDFLIEEYKTARNSIISKLMESYFKNYNIKIDHSKAKKENGFSDIKVKTLYFKKNKIKLEVKMKNKKICKYITEQPKLDTKNLKILIYIGNIVIGNANVNMTKNHEEIFLKIDAKLNNMLKLLELLIFRNDYCYIIADPTDDKTKIFNFVNIVFDLNGRFEMNVNLNKEYIHEPNTIKSNHEYNFVHKISGNGLELNINSEYNFCKRKKGSEIVTFLFDDICINFESSKFKATVKVFGHSEFGVQNEGKCGFEKVFGTIYSHLKINFTNNFFGQNFLAIAKMYSNEGRMKGVVQDHNEINSRFCKLIEVFTDNSIIQINHFYEIKINDLMKTYENALYNDDFNKPTYRGNVILKLYEIRDMNFLFKIDTEPYLSLEKFFCVKNTFYFENVLGYKVNNGNLGDFSFDANNFYFYITEKGIEGLTFDGDTTLSFRFKCTPNKEIIINQIFDNIMIFLNESNEITPLNNFTISKLIKIFMILYLVNKEPEIQQEDVRQNKGLFSFEVLTSEKQDISVECTFADAFVENDDFKSKFQFIIPEFNIKVKNGDDESLVFFNGINLKIDNKTNKIKISDIQFKCSNYLNLMTELNSSYCLTFSDQSDKTMFTMKYQSDYIEFRKSNQSNEAKSGTYGLVTVNNFIVDNINENNHSFNFAINMQLENIKEYLTFLSNFIFDILYIKPNEILFNIDMKKFPIGNITNNSKETIFVYYYINYFKIKKSIKSVNDLQDINLEAGILMKDLSDAINNTMEFNQSLQLKFLECLFQKQTKIKKSESVFKLHPKHIIDGILIISFIFPVELKFKLRDNLYMGMIDRYGNQFMLHITNQFQLSRAQYVIIGMVDFFHNNPTPDIKNPEQGSAMAYFEDAYFFIYKGYELCFKKKVEQVRLLKHKYDRWLYRMYIWFGTAGKNFVNKTLEVKKDLIMMKTEYYDNLKNLKIVNEQIEEMKKYILNIRTTLFNR